MVYTNSQCTLGNGSRCKVRGLCPAIEVKVARYNKVVDAYVLDLGGMDTILGVEWPVTLWKTETNWNRKTMTLRRMIDYNKGYQVQDRNHISSLQ